MNVLVININAIMYPCIKLYQPYISEKESSTFCWEIIEQQIGKEFIHYDSNILIKIGRLFQQITNNSYSLNYFLENSKDVYQYIKDDKVQKLTLVDFYHSCGYDKYSTALATDFKEIDNKTWCSAVDCELFEWYTPPNADKHFIQPKKEMAINSIQDINNIAVREYDQIFFISSPYEVPYEYQHLYELIKQMSVGDSNE